MTRKRERNLFSAFDPKFQPTKRPEISLGNFDDQEDN